MMTLSEELSFARICHEELSREKARESIGLLEEKRLHSVLKRWLCDDFATHEQKVAGRDEKKRKFIADVLTPDGHIFEIQTGSLFPLRQKLAFYLTKTDHRVTVVHPLMGEKYICWMDSETGEIIKRTRSTKRETVLHGVAELRYLAEYLQHPRFSVIFPVIAAEEFRLLDGWGNGGRRGSHRYELIPEKLLDVHRLTSPADYAALLPELPERFVAKEFGARTRLRGYDLYFTLAVFEALGFLQKDGKQGRATIWRKAT